MLCNRAVGHWFRFDRRGHAVAVADHFQVSVNEKDLFAPAGGLGTRPNRRIAAAALALDDVTLESWPLADILIVTFARPRPRTFARRLM